LLSSLLGALVVLIVVAVIHLDSRPDLKVWHKTILEGEFTTKSPVSDFTGYLALEDRLFSRLEREVYERVDPQDRTHHNRYSSGSLADPGRWPVNWNRSFVLASKQAKLGVLLLHGMSDSPYSLRDIGQQVHQRGAYVIGLRLPGHGQAPSGLLEATWQDMAAAVRLAMAELRQKTGNKDIYIIGYSNGAALAVQYALDSVSNDSLAPVAGLVLISPAIGISKLAMLAKWQERLGHVLGLEKLSWNSLLPEFEPWKYGSFALNAGEQAWLITSEIQSQLNRLESQGQLDRVPPILAFQSVVDATITAPALVDNLFKRLPRLARGEDHAPARRHELVLYDINRFSDIQPFMNSDAYSWIDPMLNEPGYEFLLTFLSNKGSTDMDVMAVSRIPGQAALEACDTDLSWPNDIYSLSHVALPFAPQDPVYGGEEALTSPGIDLGLVALRGERDLLSISASSMLRLRYNPFYTYQSERIHSFLNLESSPTHQCRNVLPIK
jgi:alpha-beta hydrolase superfamily lysophospholipase